MQTFENLKSFLQGKKTYFAVLIGVLYLIGVWAGFWEWDEKIIAFFGLGALAFLRSALVRNTTVLLLFCLAGLGLMASGCARFSTKQTDYSYEQGQEVRKVTTSAKAWTFFSGRSQLASFKAAQTDKTQQASVGNLSQEGGQTNQVNDLVGAAVSAAVKAATAAAAVK